MSSAKSRQPFFRKILFLASFLAAVCACSRAPAPRDDEAFQGHWEGTVDYAGNRMPLILDVAVENGRIVAEADLPHEGLENYPVELHVQNDSVRVGIQSLEGAPEMRGKLDAATQRIDGEFIFDQERFPFLLKRIGAAQISAARKEFEAAPQSQVTVVSVDAHELRDAFNRDAGKTRLLLFLSPT